MNVLVISEVYRPPDDSYAVVLVNGDLYTYWRDELWVSVFTRAYGWQDVAVPGYEKHEAVREQLWLRSLKERLEYRAGPE